MTDDLEPVNVSALNQYAYCRRRCALIYLENEFADNRHTASGNAEHARVDRVAHASNREGARVEYGVGGRGAPDLLCEIVRDGLWIAVWMEVKTDEGVLSKDQQEWHAAARKMHRNVCVVRSIAQALAVVDDVVATGRVSS